MAHTGGLYLISLIESFFMISLALSGLAMGQNSNFSAPDGIEARQDLPNSSK